MLYDKKYKSLFPTDLMVIVLIGIILAFVIFFILSIFFLFPWFFGAPFEPSDDKIVKKIYEFSKPNSKSDKMVELGSGDGRFVIEFAKHGIESHGFEINPFLVWISRRKIKKLNLQKKAFVHYKSFWKENLSKYNIIVLFQFRTIMKKLENKLNKELKPKSKILSHYWKFPGWKIKKQFKRIYVYER